MTKQTARYISIEKVVNEYISEANLTDSHFLRLWNIAVRGLEQMNYSFASEPITRKLGVLPNMIVELPGDYVDWTKIGVINDKGEIATLRINNDLSGYAATDPDRVAANTSVYQTETESQNFRNYNYNGSYVNLFGLPIGLDVAGECKVLHEEGVIILEPDYKYDHVILEYIPSPVANSDYLMPVLLQETLISWIRWKDRQSLPQGRRSNLGQRQLDRKDYFADLRKGKELVKRFRMTEANDTIRINNRLALKA
jgi:hypothetical protein